MGFTAFVIVIALVVLVAVWLLLTYNGLVSARNRTQEAWSQIDVELKRRHDLIPNLVETVKGYAAHERQTFEAVTNARKHSGADNLWVSCRVRPPAASLVVEDDGSGVAGVGEADGFGLSIMRERAQRIGATLTIAARASGGTRVTIRLPAPRDTGLLAPDEPAATRPPPVLAQSTTRAAARG